LVVAIGALIDDGAKEVPAFGRITNGELFSCFHQSGDKFIIYRRFDENTGASGAFLTLQPEGGAHQTRDCIVEVRFTGDNGRILAAQFEDGWAYIFAGPKIMINLHAHIIGAGKGDAIYIRVFDECLSKR